MSVETGFRHGDGRVRILLSYSPIDFDENEAPLAMGLMDVVITRERLNRRPLKLDDEEGGWDVLWRVTKEEDFDKLAQSDQVLSVEMQQYMPDDESRTIPSPALALNSLEVKSDQQQHHHHHDSEETCVPLPQTKKRTSLCIEECFLAGCWWSPRPSSTPESPPASVSATHLPLTRPSYTPRI